MTTRAQLIKLGIRGRPAQPIQSRPPNSPEIILQAQIISSDTATSEGQIIRAASIPWLEIYENIKNDPSFLTYFSKYPRKFEEFIAASYDRAGFDEVTLTPQRGDGGRDVIAVKKGWGSIRILEQTKAYSPGHLVTHDDVRAMLGVLGIDRNSSKGLITTTSDFQPGILKGPDFQPYMPHRLELKNGVALTEWLSSIANEPSC